MKRIVVWMLVLMLSLSAASGFCQAETAPEPITMTAFLDSLPSPSDWTWGQDPTSQRITELTGVTVEVTNAGTTDHTELNTLLASGMELPDFIITGGHTTLRRMMVDQGFVQPLTDLANQYSPEFWDELPYNMDKVYQEADGKLYCIADWYGDENRHDDLLLNNFAQISVSLKIDLYEEMGRPEVSTFEQWKDYLVSVKEKHPEIGHVIFDMNPNSPRSNQSLINVLARMYGAESSYFSIGEDNSVTMNFRTEGYKKALSRYHELYRAGLINPETFVYKTEQKKSVLADQDLACYVGNYWSLIEYMNELFELKFETIDFPIPEDGVEPEEFFIHDDYYSIGGGSCVFITKDCKAPDRAIQYLTFLMSEDGQLLQRYGVEGITWEADDLGRPMPTELKTKTEAESFDTLQRDLGVYNYQFSWNTSNWASAYGAHNTYQVWPGMMQDIEKIQDRTRNEMLYDMVDALSDEDGLVLQQQINDLWDRSISSIVLSDTDEQFEQAYQNFLSDAERLGVDRLEEYYEANLADLRSRGL